MNRRRVGLGTTVAILAGVIIFGAREQVPTETRIPVNQAYEIAATRALSYQAVPVERKTGWGVARGLDATINHMKERFDRHDGPFQINVRGVWGPKRNLNPTLQRLHDLAKHLPYFGARPPKFTVLVVRAFSDSYRERFRKHDKNPAMIIDTEGTQAIDIIVGTTAVQFPIGLRVLGIYVCRTIAGSGTLSQHAFGNAVDWGASTSLLDRVARFQYGLVKKGYLPISQLIWRGRDMLSGHSVYDHYNHIHDSGRPLQSGGCRRPGISQSIPSYVSSTPFEGAE